MNVSFGLILPAKSQILIRSFLQKFTVSENSLIMLFLRMMRAGSYIIFLNSLQFGDNIQTARQLRNAVFAKFFDKS